MFRCFIGRGSMSVSDLESRINEWVESNGEWENNPAGSGSLKERNEGIDGSNITYHAVDVWFLPDNSKANLQAKFEDKLQNKVSWYRVGYHQCTHREGDGTTGACPWDSQLEWTAKDVTIPTGVPVLVE